MNPQVIVTISEDFNQAIIDYQKALKGMTNKRTPSKAKVIEGLQFEMTEVLNQKTEQIKEALKKMEELKKIAEQ